VPVDVQLTTRCPAFLDQESLVAGIADSLPPGCKLYIKEHPAAIGGHSLSKLVSILRDRKNIRLLHPACNSYDIIKNSACVITVNSKVGFEAIIQGKPVIVLGKTFYRGKDLSIDVNNMDELAEKIRSAVSNYSVTGPQKEAFLAQAFNWTCKGELYDNSAENLDAFYSSLKVFLTKCGTIPQQEHIDPNELNTKPLDITDSA
jgi:capsule polysaccharide modification protein KpsS